jgi:DNA replication licensing factor MCM5
VPGEIPRALKLCVSRNLVAKLSPGTRVTITGIYTVNENNYLKNRIGTSKMRIPYINTLGLVIEKVGTRKYEARFT